MSTRAIRGGARRSAGTLNNLSVVVCRYLSMVVVVVAGGGVVVVVACYCLFLVGRV